MDRSTRLHRLMTILGDFASVDCRSETARALAHELGCETLILFTRDPETGVFLPVRGFPQTIPNGRWWRELLTRAASMGTASSELPGEGKIVHAFAVRPDAVVALIGGPAEAEAIEDLLVAMPLASALCQGETAVQISSAQASMARRSAADATALAQQLDTTRSELSRALAVAESAAQARDEFLATVSHELRTPLTGILGWTQILRADALVREEGADALDTIEKNAKALTRLIEDILDFSRINAGKLKIEVKPVDLVDVLRSSIDIIRPAADAKGVKIQTTFDSNAGSVSGDADRLQQVFWNLLSNALKFTRRDGRVHVVLERLNSHVEIVVADSGEGIAPEFLPFVFDRFSQADSSSSRSHAGLGLGLGIVKNLVDLHGGTVHALSQGVGKGSTFIVRLPLLAIRQQESSDRPQLVKADDPAVAPFHPDEHDFPDLSQVSILVVDDNEDARRILQKFFEKCRANVTLASHAEQGLDSVRRTPPDIIVSDIEMPGQDGYSFIQKIRALPPPYSRIPAVALTAHTRMVERVRALSAGFQAHLAKPVEPLELVSIVRSLLNIHSPR